MTRSLPLALLALGVVVTCGACAADGPSEPVACTTEQLTTLTGGSGVPVSEPLVESGSATFEPESIVDGLASECLLSFESSGSTASFAVLAGGTGTLETVTERLEEADSGATSESGQVTAVIDGNTVVAAPFSLVTQQTDGFDDPDDLVVVISSPVQSP